MEESEEVMARKTEERREGGEVTRGERREARSESDQRRGREAERRDGAVSDERDRKEDLRAHTRRSTKGAHQPIERTCRHNDNVCVSF